jgi:hypothetical protein
VLRRVLWRLWHIEEGLERSAEQIKVHSQTLDDLRAEKVAKDDELAAVRAEQAKSRSTVTQKEKRIKKAEQTLEIKVLARIFDIRCQTLTNIFVAALFSRDRCSDCAFDTQDRAHAKHSGTSRARCQEPKHQVARFAERARSNSEDG